MVRRLLVAIVALVAAWLGLMQQSVSVVPVPTTQNVGDIAPSAAGDRGPRGSSATGGGHLWPGLPGKAPFPKVWSGDRIVHEVSDIATDPTRGRVQITGVPGAAFTRKGAPVRYEIGNRGGIDSKVILEPGGEGIITAHAR